MATIFCFLFFFLFLFLESHRHIHIFFRSAHFDNCLILFYFVSFQFPVKRIAINSCYFEMNKVKRLASSLMEILKFSASRIFHRDVQLTIRSVGDFSGSTIVQVLCTRSG